MARCKYKGQFGPQVIGQAAFDSETVDVSEGKEIFGDAVLGKHPSSKNDPGPENPIVVDVQAEVPDVTPEMDSLSVRAVKLALKETSAPSALDNFARAEFMRPEGVRKSVLDILLKKERGREDPPPRPESIEALESKLAELEG